MASIMQRRLVCPGCSSRSGPRQDGSVRRWQCKSCETVTCLDENGNIITDPQALVESSQPRYAHSIPRPASPDAPALDESIFCSTCLKNQHIQYTLKADYLPEDSDPDYEKFVKAYRRYEAQLEERHPQTCAKCQPGVERKIEQAGNTAKADYLRRMLDSSRRARFRSTWGWRSLLIAAGALGYWGSVAGQLAWDFMSVMTRDDFAYEPQFLSADLARSPSECFNQILFRRHVEIHCSQTFAPAAGFALVLGLASLWWNPRLRNKVKGRQGRMVGLSAYYRDQIIVLVFRSAAWGLLQSPDVGGLDPSISWIGHVVMLIVMIVSVIKSRFTVQIDTTPLALWKESSRTLLPQRPANQAQFSSPQPHNPTDAQSTGPVPGTRSPAKFRVTALAPQSPNEPRPSVWPTPPPEESDTDAMDWTPSQQSFQPHIDRSQRQEYSAAPQPSPFYGHLPPKPTNVGLLRRHPARQEDSDDSEDSSVQGYRAPFDSFRGQYADLFNALSGKDTGPTSAHAIAQPKFFPHADHNNDTGLEGLFDTTFSMHDEPHIVRNAIRPPRRSSETPVIKTSPRATSPHTISTCLLVLCLLVWQITDSDSLHRRHMEIAGLAIASMVAGLSLLEALNKPRNSWSLSDVLLFLVEVAISIFFVINQPHGPAEWGLFDTVRRWLLICITLQEAYLSSISQSWTQLATVLTKSAPVSQPSSQGPNAEVGSGNALMHSGSSGHLTHQPPAQEQQPSTLGSDRRSGFSTMTFSDISRDANPSYGTSSYSSSHLNRSSDDRPLTSNSAYRDSNGGFSGLSLGDSQPPRPGPRFRPSDRF